MDRSDFIKNVLGAAVAPALIKDFLIDDEKSLAFAKGTTKKFALDMRAISDVGIGNGGKKITAREILQLYKETGVLIYRNPYPENTNYNPITILE